MSPVYLNPQQSSSLSFLDLKGDQQLPILGYLHDHVTSANNHAYFSCSSFENHRNSAEFLAMEYSRRAQDKVVEKLFQSHDKLTNNQSQVIPSSTQTQYTTLDSSGCSYINPIDQGDPKIETTKTNQKPKKCKPTKLRIMQRETAIEKPKKMKVEHKPHHHDHVVQTQRNMYHNTSNENGSHGFLRMCSDCHTTTTPLWRSGPQGPKSLCNACGIRQRKARRAAMAAAAAAASTVTSPLSSITTTTTTTTTTMKLQSPNKLIDEEIKSKLSFDHEKNYTLPLKKRSKTLHSWNFNNNTNTNTFNNDNTNNNNNNDNNINNNYDNDNNNKEYGFSQRKFPRDEEEGAILLMALSCGLACSS